MSPNKKKIWGVVLGSQKPNHIYADQAHKAGKWIGEPNGSNLGARDTPGLLFFTRKEAEEYAQKQEQGNSYWTFLAKKYHPKP